MTLLASLRQCSVKVYASVPAVTILMLIMCSKLSAIFWQGPTTLTTKSKIIIGTMTQNITNSELKIYYTTTCRGMSVSAVAGAGGCDIATE